jgi:hypothetical protein
MKLFVGGKRSQKGEYFVLYRRPMRARAIRFHSVARYYFVRVGDAIEMTGLGDCSFIHAVHRAVLEVPLTLRERRRDNV